MNRQPNEYRPRQPRARTSSKKRIGVDRSHDREFETLIRGAVARLSVESNMANNLILERLEDIERSIKLLTRAVGQIQRILRRERAGLEPSER